MAYYKERETYFSARWVVLSERDELAFSRVLREFCPEVLFFEEQSASVTESSVPIVNIPHAKSRYVSMSVPAPGQEKAWRLNVEMQRQFVRPWVRLDLDRSRWVWLDPSKKWAFDLPLLNDGRLGVAYPKADPETKRFAMKLLRLVGKITWKRGCYGLESCIWSQGGGNTRRALGVGIRIPPERPIKLNKYYDDTLWDDRLPAEPTGARVEQL